MMSCDVGHFDTQTVDTVSYWGTDEQGDQVNTREVAEQFETTPKVLRQFLRADENYANAGSGGTYDFKKAELKVMRKRFDAWLTEKEKNTVTRRPRKTTYKKGDSPGLDPAILLDNSPAARAAKRKIAEERVDNLEMMLKSRNNHISQMRERH